MSRTLVAVVAVASLALASAGAVAGAEPGPAHVAQPDGAGAGPDALVAQDQPDRGQDDELEQGERVGHGHAKELSGTSVLATFAGIAAASLVVVLAGLGVFGRRRHRGHA